MARMASPPVIDDGDFVAVAQAGTTIGSLAEAAERAGFSAPGDTLYGFAATVGGAFMSGAFGPSSGFSRVLRDAVIGVRCVTADGSVVTGGGRTAKNVTGYEITRFFAGTMGLFGAAFELIVRLTPHPGARRVVTAYYGNGVSHWDSLSGLVRDMSCLTFADAVHASDGTTCVAYVVEGLEAIADTAAQTIADIASEAGNADIAIEDWDVFAGRRRADKRFALQPGFCTASIPSASWTSFLDTIAKEIPGVPVLVQPLAGKAHFIAGDAVTADRIGTLCRALGGKSPISYDRLVSEGLRHMFTPAELDIIMRLKRELDPRSMLNPALLGL
jgi:FAD/FMN-containing dehydrogenase